MRLSKNDFGIDRPNHFHNLLLREGLGRIVSVALEVGKILGKFRMTAYPASGS